MGYVGQNQCSVCFDVDVPDGWMSDSGTDVLVRVPSRYALGSPEGEGRMLR